MSSLKQYISNDDWSCHSINALRQANSGNWGFARNEYLEMGKLVLEEGRLEQALKLFLYVCVLDLNGAQNRGNLPKHTLQELPSFDPTMASLEPDVVEDLRWMAEETRISMDYLRACFFKIASARFLPVPADASWSVFTLVLQGEIDLNDQPRCRRQILDRINEREIAALSRSAFRTVGNWFKSNLISVFPVFVGGGREKEQTARR